MTELKRSKIEVKPSTLNNLIVAVEEGDYRIPQFQREYVWERTKVVELFDSIYKQYPIGSFFLWKADRTNNHLFRHSADLDIRPIADDDDVSFILDGQQRITSLYVAMKGLTASRTDYGKVCFDVKNEKFTFREADNKQYFRVADIWGSDGMTFGRMVDKNFSSAFDRCYNVLRTYPISVVEVRDQDFLAVCRIFQRINQGGKRLDRFDLVAAKTFTPEFDLRRRFQDDVIAKLKAKKFGAISPAIITKLIALHKKDACTERSEFSLTSSDIRDSWAAAVESILLAAELLRANTGVQTAQYLPYDALLTMASYFFLRSAKRAPTDAQLAWIKRWFWRATFGQYYGSASSTKMGRDKEMFDRLIDHKEEVAFDPPINLTVEELLTTKMTRSSSAVRNGFLCLLANRGPVHLLNNSRLDLVVEGISEFTSPEKHHVFPQAYLRRAGDEFEVHSLPNFCFLPAELNKRISDKNPSEYFSVLKSENSKFFDACDTHLLPTDQESGVWDNNYLKFMKARARIILDEVERLTARKTTPVPNARHKSIEQIERRLREVIDEKLSAAHGREYWKVAVPSDIREDVEKKIASALRRPDVDPLQFTESRAKLNFCNLPDYSKLILMKGNWPQFESAFRRRADVERHFEALSEFRNAVMHGRNLSEMSEMAGELALLWFESALSRENANASETSDDEENDRA